MKIFEGASKSLLIRHVLTDFRKVGIQFEVVQRLYQYYLHFGGKKRACGLVYALRRLFVIAYAQRLRRKAYHELARMVLNFSPNNTKHTQTNLIKLSLSLSFIRRTTSYPREVREIPKWSRSNQMLGEEEAG